MQRVTMHMGAKLKKLLRMWASACFDLRPTIPPTPPLLPLPLKTSNQVIVFLVVHLAINDWQEYVRTWNSDWSDDKLSIHYRWQKGQICQKHDGPKGLSSFTDVTTFTSYDSVYQLLTAFTSNHQVLTAFINGKCLRVFSIRWDPFPLYAMQNSMTQPT